MTGQGSGGGKDKVKHKETSAKDMGRGAGDGRLGVDLQPLACRVSNIEVVN